MIYGISRFASVGEFGRLTASIIKFRDNHTENQITSVQTSDSFTHQIQKICQHFFLVVFVSFQHVWFHVILETTKFILVRGIKSFSIIQNSKSLIRMSAFGPV